MDMALKKLNKRKTYHFIGIGGCGMSALAKTLIEKGISVSGSDIKETLTTIKLKDLGAKIFIGHKKENLKNGMYQIVITEIPYQINKARLNCKAYCFFKSKLDV